MRVMWIVALLLATVFSIKAEESVPEYQVVKETLDKKVPDGKCRVFGKVTYEKVPVKGVKVSTIAHKEYTVSEGVGNYSFLIDAKKIKLYAFQIGFGEIVTEEYDFKKGHSVHIDFYLQEKNSVKEVEKPVIYLYSPSTLSVNLTLDFKGELSFSYPEYNNGWNVEVTPSGNLVDAISRKEYPYLFWEGKQQDLSFTSLFNAFDGYQINTDSTISFLELKLTELGLNEKEQTDFITYWAPRIIQKQYATIQFLVDEDYASEIGALNVTPKPDCIRRVYLLFTGGDQATESVHSVPRKIKPFHREGFTIIEWGGTELSPRKRVNP